MNQISFDALIVAAGRPRQDSGFSPAQRLGSLSVIRRIIHTFRQAGASTILIVTGYQARNLEKHLARSGVICVRNDAWETTDMMYSVKLGLSRFKDQDGSLLLTPADIPLFTLSTVRKLLQSGAPLAVPGIGGRNGHPLLISKHLIPQLLSYEGTLGLKDAVIKTGIPKKVVEVYDEGVLIDVENEREYDTLLERHNRQPFCPRVMVSLERELPFIDRDSAMLLRLVEQVHSVRRACSLMGISYSKGWKILNEMELQSGITMIKRKAGGQTGGSTELTSKGLAFLKRFEQYEKNISLFAASEFYRMFPEMGEQSEMIQTTKKDKCEESI